MSTDCNVIYCDHCGRMSRTFDCLTYHDICYAEHELEPGPTSPRNWQAEVGFFVELDGNGFGADYPTHEHWCIECWNKLTLPYKKPPKRFRIATAWERLQLEDPIQPDAGLVELTSNDPAVPWRQQPVWNCLAHYDWEDRRGK